MTFTDKLTDEATAWDNYVAGYLGSVALQYNRLSIPTLYSTDTFMDAAILSAVIVGGRATGRQLMDMWGSG